MPLKYGVDRRQLCARHHRLRAMHAEGRGQRAAAARHAVRADPLERGQRDRGARRRAGGAVHRSVLRPAREQGDAGVDRALRICVPRLCAVAQAARIAGACLVGARRRHRRLWLSVRRQCRSRRAGNPGCGRMAGDDLAEYKDFGGGVYRAASFAGDRIETCLFIGPAARCRRLERGQEPVRGRHARATSSAACCCRANRADGLASAGPIVCACFGVGRTTICDAIAAARAPPPRSAPG